MADTSLFDELFVLLKEKAQQSDLPDGEVRRTGGIDETCFYYRFTEGWETFGLWYDEETIRDLLPLNDLADKIIGGFILAHQLRDTPNGFKKMCEFYANLLKGAA